MRVSVVIQMCLTGRLISQNARRKMHIREPAAQQSCRKTAGLLPTHHCTRSFEQFEVVEPGCCLGGNCVNVLLPPEVVSNVYSKQPERANSVNDCYLKCQRRRRIFVIVVPFVQTRYKRTLRSSRRKFVKVRELFPKRKVRFARAEQL